MSRLKDKKTKGQKDEKTKDKDQKDSLVLWRQGSFARLRCLSFYLCVFLSGHHSDRISEGSQVSNVTLCVQILKCHWLINRPTDRKYSDARAAKKGCLETLVHSKSCVSCRDCIYVSCVAISWRPTPPSPLPRSCCPSWVQSQSSCAMPCIVIHL